MENIKNVKANWSTRYGWTLQRTSEYCDNCGRLAHDGPLMEEFKDGNNEIVIIEVCKEYRKQEKFDELA
ncbi:MAG: hypothetical protein CMA64_09470 [Euryarchaeota archaeon]|jgi:hypothetical protein|nr:hypothetical protein [Euryarchaeota archaeon]